MSNNDFRIYEKKILRGLLSDDKLEQLQAQLREITTDDAHKDLLNEVLQNAGRLADYRRTLTAGTATSDELRIARNQIRVAFLNIIDALPDEMSLRNDPSVKMPKLMSEQGFKSWILRILVGGKLLLIVAAIVLVSSATWVELLMLIFVWLPTLLLFLSILFADIQRRRNDLFPTGNDRKTVSASMRRTTFGVLALYFLILLLLIDAYARGNFADTENVRDLRSLVTWIGVLECLFSVYIGQIVYGLFREK